MNKYVATLTVLVLAIAVCEAGLLLPGFGKAPSKSTDSGNAEVVKDDGPTGFLSRIGEAGGTIGQGISKGAKTVEKKITELFNPKEEKPDTPPDQPETKSGDKKNQDGRNQIRFAVRCEADEVYKDGSCRPNLMQGEQ